MDKGLGNLGDRMVKTGIWTQESGVNYTQSDAQRVEQTAQKIQNKTLRVVTTDVSKITQSMLCFSIKYIKFCKNNKLKLKIN